jgi:hypothetical protein
MAWIKNKGRKTPRPASMTAPTRPATMGFSAAALDESPVAVIWHFQLGDTGTE